MNKEEMNYFAGKLMEEKERIFKQLKGRKTDQEEDSLRESIQELSLLDNHPADTASETYERSKDLSLDEKKSLLIQQIDRALERILEGVYGVCVECGRPIAYERLEAIPYAELCVECKEKMEKMERKDERPEEELTLSVPFARTFMDEKDATGFDGEDTWQEVEKYGSSSTLQDGSGNNGKEERGAVDRMDKLPSNTSEEERRRVREKKES